MIKEKVTPKLLSVKRILEIYQVSEALGQVFEGSPMCELFGHIAGLTELIKQRDKQLVDTIKAIVESPVEA